MLIEALLAAHIIVVGYWLGSELVINSTYRMVSYADTMPFAERARLMDHVMHADQHVRYALVLQAMLGTVLAVLLGYLPGGSLPAGMAALLGICWLALVEFTHRLRKRPAGIVLAKLDRSIRYGMIGLLAASAIAILSAAITVPQWLAWKLFAFAGVIACGLGIRFFLIDFFRVWKGLETEGSNAERETTLRRIYVGATSVLGLLWVLIGVIVVLSVWKPG
jgi:hypothetical protein